MSEPLIVLIGAGGIGCPAALALGKSGASRLRVVDEDRVEVSNLHRQVLFEPSDVGRPKTATFAERLRQHFPSLDVSAIEDRVLPDNAWDLLEDAAVVIDATDNYPSRFVVADAARLMGIPVVHAAAVKWQATVMACSSRGEPCYRCLFEDLPDGPVVDCATAGVAPPVCAVAGAVAADRALRILAGDEEACGCIVTYDGWSDRLRQIRVPRRAGCPLCGDEPSIDRLDRARYVRGGCESRGARDEGPLSAAQEKGEAR